MNEITQTEKFNHTTKVDVFFDIGAEDLKTQLLKESNKCLEASVFLAETIGFHFELDIFYETSKEYSKLFLINKMIEFLKRKQRLLSLINSHQLYNNYLLYVEDHDEWEKQNTWNPRKFSSFNNKKCHLRLV
jgi:hypothetical protein